MPFSADTSYGPGSVRQTTAGDFPGGAGIDPFFMEMASREMSFRDAKRKRELAMMDEAANERLNAKQKANAPKPFVVRPQNLVPKTLSYAGGSAGFYTPDPLRMTGEQRRDFLPQGSSQVGGFGPGAAPSEDAPDWGFGPNTKHIQGSEGSYTGKGENAEKDPFPHGTGAAFERTRMANALTESNAEWEKRQAQRRALMGGPAVPTAA